VNRQRTGSELQVDRRIEMMCILQGERHRERERDRERERERDREIERDIG